MLKLQPCYIERETFYWVLNLMRLDIKSLQAHLDDLKNRYNKLTIELEMSNKRAQQNIPHPLDEEN